MAEIEGLKNKVCVVTGAAGVLCSVMAEALLEAGAKVALLDLNLERAEEKAKELSSKGEVIAVAANVMDRPALEEAKKTINEKLGKIHLLLNGAGGNSPKATTQVETATPDDLSDLSRTFFGLDTDGFDFCFALNFKGTLLPTMVFAQDMLHSGEGIILNVTSMNAIRPLTKIPAYSAAKAAVDNFTKWLSVHLAKTGIRVNSVAPGFFVTDQNRFLLYDKDSGELTARGRKILDHTPSGRYGEPEDLKGAVQFLCSDMGKFVTGITLPIDGGFSAYSGV